MCGNTTTATLIRTKAISAAKKKSVLVHYSNTTREPKPKSKGENHDDKNKTSGIFDFCRFLLLLNSRTHKRAINYCITTP